MKVISGTHETPEGRLVAGWFGSVVGREQSAPYSAMGWVKGGGFDTAAVFTDYNGSNIEVHFVGRLSRQAVRETLQYAFLQLKVLRITAKPFVSRSEFISQLERLGFKREGVMENYYGVGGDALVLLLTKNEAQKWMR